MRLFRNGFQSTKHTHLTGNNVSLVVTLVFRSGTSWPLGFKGENVFSKPATTVLLGLSLLCLFLSLL